jgi:arginase family enzyme
MKTTAVFLPFDLFGSAGTSNGVALLADAFKELLADNRRERRPTRARAYAGKVRVQEFLFEKLEDYRNWRKEARQVARQLLSNGDFLFWITGNHLGALPLYEELGKETLVVQLDAHLDVYNLSDCTAELSHGNFLLHADTALPRIVGVGHRELLLPAEHIGKYYEATFSAADVATDADAVLTKLRQRSGEATKILIDIDCDVFDPAFFPAVSHPLPFGISPAFLLRILDAVWSERVVGVSISEFEPGRDQNDRSLATLVWLLEYLLLQRYETT